MRFHVNTLVGHSAAVVRCSGDIIYKHEADLFYDTVERLHQPLVLLDMEHVRVIDAYGIGRLATLLKKRWKQGKELRVVNPQPRLRELLRLTKLDDCIAEPNLPVTVQHNGFLRAG
jgi:anti-anti-sigma factor